MKWFLNLRTPTKLIAFFAVMVVGLVLTNVAGVSSVRAMKARQASTYDVDLQAIAYLERLAIERFRVARTVRDAVIERDPAKVADYARVLERSETMLRASIDEARANVKDDSARLLITEISEELPRAFQLGRDAIASTPRSGYAGDPARLEAALAACGKFVDSFDAKVAAEVTRLKAQATARATESDAAYAKQIEQSIALLLAVLALGAICTRLISRAIAVPLKKSVEVLESFAQGDLTVKLDADREDEIGDMARALNASLASVRATLHEVTTVSNEVTSASGELALNAQQLSTGAQSQAASLEETAASLEEISSTVKQNTDNAQAASQLAMSARDAAERGGVVVGGAVAAMGEITNASKKIADIIATIDEIAFQTNLLALNAAVEAARAGEQGRGFAVVASEVRTLAQRTGTAAKEIRGLIADSTAKVEVGTQQVNESGRTLQEIVRTVKQVTDMVAEIAAASREQNTGVDQVNTAVTEVDQITQSNAAQTEALADTANTLSTRASHLMDLVSAFQLGDHAAVAGRPQPQAEHLVRAVPTSGTRKAAARLRKAS